MRSVIKSEPALHLIQPGATGGGEMSVESAPLLGPQPTLDGGALVGTVIVHDEMNIHIRRRFLFQFVEEPDELPAAMAGQAAPHHFPVQDVESRKQRGRPMSLIVVRLTFWQARSQGQDRSRPIQGMDLTLLVDAKHQGSIRGVEVKPTTSRTFSSNFGLLEILNFSTR